MRPTALLAALALAAGTAAAGTPLADPADPGPDMAAGRSALEEVLAEEIPWPFEALLARLRAEAGADNVATALVPLDGGAAAEGAEGAPPRDPFASPLVVVAVTGDWASGPGAPRLADRLFLGYQPARDWVEAIAWNDTAARFEFQRITGYAEGGTPRVVPVERRVCVACHRAQGPIFTGGPWRGTNADPAVARRLAALGSQFHGAPVAGTVDAMAAIEAAVERAARAAVANRLWSEGCGDNACRAALLTEALRFGLNGMRPGWRPAGPPEADAFADRVAGLWPEGLTAPPALRADAPAPARLALPEPGAATADQAVPLWRPGAEDWLDAVRLVAGLLAPGDYAWLDGGLGTGGTGAEAGAEAGGGTVGTETLEMACDARIVGRAAGREVRLDCGGADGRLLGFLAGEGGAIRGRIDTFGLGPRGGFGRFPVTATEEDGVLDVFAGREPRLDDGRRLAALRIARSGAGATARIGIADDFSEFARRLGALAQTDEPAFAAGPFRRAAILSAIETALAGAGG